MSHVIKSSVCSLGVFKKSIHNTKTGKKGIIGRFCEIFKKEVFLKILQCSNVLEVAVGSKKDTDSYLVPCGFEEVMIQDLLERPIRSLLS